MKAYYLENGRIGVSLYVFDVARETKAMLYVENAVNIASTAVYPSDLYLSRVDKANCFVSRQEAARAYNAAVQKKVFALKEDLARFEKSMLVEEK